MTEMPATPELEKQSAAIKDGAHKIGEFLDWLESEGIVLARHGERSGYLVTVSGGFQELIAGFYKIDLNKIEQERRALLAYVRAQQESVLNVHLDDKAAKDA